MKKLAMLLTLPTILAACDSKPQAEILFSACCSAEEKYGVMKLSVWDNEKMVLNINGEDVLLKAEEDAERVPSKKYRFEMRGVIPSTKKEISVMMRYDAEKKLLGIMSCHISDDAGYGIDNYVSIDLKGYRMPNATEQCIEKIGRLIKFSDNGVAFVWQKSQFWSSREIQKIDPESRSGESISIKIPTEDAIAISKNWDPNNFKPYLNSEKSPTVEEHEKDACDVLARLKTYIADKGYDKPVDIYLDEVGCDKPSKVIKLGANRARYNYYDAYALNICENGNHYLLDISDAYFVDNPEDRYAWIPVKQSGRDDKIIYSTYNAYAAKLLDIVYSPDTDEYAIQFVGYGLNSPVKFEKLNDFQKVNSCAYRIYNRTRVNAGVIEVEVEGESKIENGELKIKQEFVPLTQEQALTISKNWDYKNMKLYHTGEQPHEADACETLERLNAYTWRLRREKENAENKE